LIRKFILEETSKTEGSLEAKQCPTFFSSSILANNNFQQNHYRTRYLQMLHSSLLVETTRDIPTENSLENSRKILNRQQKFDVPEPINPRSNSSQYNGCGIYNGNKSSQIEVAKTLADENLCLKRN